MDVYISFAADMKPEEQAAILQDSPDKLRGMSQRIEQGRAVWKSWAESNGGSIINAEGPFGRVMVPAENLDRVPEIREQYAGKVDATVSVGIGMKLDEADKALGIAQKRGGNTILFFSPALEQEEDKKAKEKGADPVAQLAAAYVKKSEPLDKGIGKQLGALGAAAMLSLPASTQDMSPPTPPAVVEQAGPPAPSPRPWSKNGLHADLHPIARLESNDGQNVQHAPHSQGVLHTAVGALGMKPITGWEQYQRDPALQRRFAGIESPEAFAQQLTQDPDLYNTVAGSEWNRIKRQTGGSLAATAYAWRRGLTASLRTPREQIQKDPYVQQYLRLLRKPMRKAIEDNHAEAVKDGIADAGALPLVLRTSLYPSGGWQTFSGEHGYYTIDGPLVSYTPKLEQNDQWGDPLYGPRRDIYEVPENDPDFHPDDLYDVIEHHHRTTMAQLGKPVSPYVSSSDSPGGRVARGLHGQTGQPLTVTPTSAKPLPETKSLGPRMSVIEPVGSHGNQPTVDDHSEHKKRLHALELKEKRRLEEEMRKAEGPSLNQGAGAGMAGAAQAAAPSVMKRPQEGSEHTQGEAVQSLFEEQHQSPEMTHAGKDMKDILQQHAEAQHAEDDDKQQTEKSVQDMKGKIVGILQQVKAAAPAIEELRSTSPEVFKAVTGSVEALLVLAQQLDAFQKKGGQPMQKALPMPGAPLRHPIVLPSGSTKSGAAADPKHGTGKQKVTHGDGKQGWIQARAGQVASQERDQMGNAALPHPISSLNPKGH